LGYKNSEYEAKLLAILSEYKQEGNLVDSLKKQLEQKISYLESQLTSCKDSLSKAEGRQVNLVEKWTF
jgi:hypothetical protein